jgi:hypothetical protein
VKDITAHANFDRNASMVSDHRNYLPQYQNDLLDSQASSVTGNSSHDFINI